MFHSICTNFTFYKAIAKGNQWVPLYLYRKGPENHRLHITTTNYLHYFQRKSLVFRASSWGRGLNFCTFSSDKSWLGPVLLSYLKFTVNFYLQCNGAAGYMDTHLYMHRIPGRYGCEPLPVLRIYMHGYHRARILSKHRAILIPYAARCVPL